MTKQRLTALWLFLFLTCLSVYSQALAETKAGGGTDNGYGTITSPAKQTPTADDLPTNVDKYKDIEVNGIRFADYEGFEKDWRLVTVTFRTDAREMRFSYANDLAYDTLLKKSTDYPDGATFIKVAILTEGDPAFVASEVPGTTRRYQVMRRDKNLYTATDGWGYAVFASTPWGYDIVGWDGKVARDSVLEMQGKCHACHTLVKDRGFVFSRIASITPNKPDTPPPAPTVSPHQPAVGFKTTLRSTLPATLQPFIPAHFKNVRVIDSATTSAYAYIGVAYEARLLMIAEANKSNLPAVYFDDNKASMIAVYPTDKKHEPLSPTCKSGERLLASYWRISGNKDHWPSKDLFCFGEESLPKINAVP